MKGIYCWCSLLVLWLGLLSCRLELDPALDVTTIQIKIELEPALKNAGLSPIGTEVVLEDRSGNGPWRAIANAEGIVRFEEMVGGTYQVKARRLIQMDEYRAHTGISVDEDVILMDSLVNQSFSLAGPQQATITLRVKPLGGWLIKQVYYAGSDTLNGVGIRDQFVEVYNNSNADLYADSLYIGFLSGVESKTIPTEYLVAATGQYDWSKSLNIPDPSKATTNTEYSYAHTVVMIPGTGSQYRVRPGESIVIAQNAQNHKVGYTTTDGKKLVTKKPELTVDLSTADFEVVLGRKTTDIDNVAVPNLRVVYCANLAWEMNPGGTEAIVLFRTKANVMQWPKVPTPNVRIVTSSTPLQVQIPNQYILDGLDLQPSSTLIYPKKLPASIDASSQYVPKGAYSSQSLIRRTNKSIGLRRVLMNSQNSTSDFGYFELAQPRGFQ
ncbi:DUF4876 domain-containing protein [Siphonobacter curvatus]|uniref:DUF4876 domain-containing protein n=1 Tax=Siphonobacter curvatus TaxID=2094562 RepID=A0A2S7ILL8_9BACT|nr:DUF4876 domain-containing protein [Siphonobacter curvatus]PQA58624.1 hypothetical protein C5O19_02875 [Siphonobacter curvatus]